VLFDFFSAATTEFAIASGITDKTQRIRRGRRYLVIALPYHSPERAKPGRMAVMGQITIRVARPGDARGIARLDVETWRTTYAGVLSTSYLVGLSERRRELGRRLLITLFRRLVAVSRRSAIVWVLRDNPSRFFYERLGGHQVSRKPLAVGGSAVEAVAYGWRDLPGFLAAVSSEDREPEP
jgi:hypothetical protein